MTLKFIKTMALTLFVIALASPSDAMDRISVQVSVLPQKYFVDRIGGDRVNVDVLVQPGKSPSTYSPSPGQIRKLLSACVYFKVGVPFENGLLDKIHALAPSTRIVDTREGITLRTMSVHHHDDEGDGDAHDGEHEQDTEHHDHAGKDPHIWMSPVLVEQQARTMYRALCDCDPEGRPLYTRNLETFLNELDRLDQDLKKILSPVKGSNIFVFHPSFGYFTDQYQLNQVAIETMGKAPKGKDLARLIQTFKNDKARIIFVQPQFDSHTAQRIAGAINGTVMAIDPLAYDYKENMISMAHAILSALKP